MRIVVAVTVLVTVTATPAMADPARPTNYESEVTALDPAVPGVQAEVIGGDTFLELTVSAGTTVLVPGYEGEPYLRFEPDGEVLVNRNSPAFWLNNDRYAQIAVPADVTAADDPDWQPVGRNGRWAWHDHRIHWMSPEPPGSLTGNGTQDVFAWAIPIEVDGAPVTVNGVLDWHPSENPLLPLVVTGLVALAVFWLGRRLKVASGIALVIGSLAALAVTLSRQVTTPPGAGVEVVPIAASALALTSASAFVALRRRGSQAANPVGVVSVVLLIVWGMQNLSAMWMPILSSALQPAVERALIAAALGCGLGVLAAMVLEVVGPARTWTDKPIQAT
jgi:hypothetical protein